MEQSQVKHELLFCARVLLGNIRRIFLFKNLGYWNAYIQYMQENCIVEIMKVCTLPQNLNQPYTTFMVPCIIKPTQYNPKLTD